MCLDLQLQPSNFSEAVEQISEQPLDLPSVKLKSPNMRISVYSSVYATTAANAEESSYACYYDEKRDTYLGDWYSVNWMEDSDVVCDYLPHLCPNHSF